MSTTKNVKLLSGATNVFLFESTDIETTITYNAPPWGPHKTCIHKLPGKWEIKYVNKHLVTLVNHNEIIQENETNIL